jgi:hypothetical protein
LRSRQEPLYACDNLSISSGSLFRRLDGLGLRRFAARYLLVFLAAVAIAPHQHVNAIEDLLSDGPSDSGIVLEGSGPQDPTAGLQWSIARFTDDDPCLACFHNDWATEPIALLVLVPTFRPTTLAQALHLAAIPAPPPGPGRSRAPPAAA